MAEYLTLSLYKLRVFAIFPHTRPTSVDNPTSAVGTPALFAFGCINTASFVKNTENCGETHQSGPALIVLSVKDAADHVSRTFQTGTNDYLLKGVAGLDVIKTISTVGYRYFGKRCPDYLLPPGYRGPLLCFPVNPLKVAGSRF